MPLLLVLVTRPSVATEVSGVTLGARARLVQDRACVLGTYGYEQRRSEVGRYLGMHGSGRIAKAVFIASLEPYLAKTGVGGAPHGMLWTHAGDVNNAGRAGAARRTVSSDGYEVTLQINYLAPFLLTTLLRHEYSPVRAYAQSKLAIVVYTHALAEQLAGTPCEAVSLHAGVITTRLLDSLFHMRGDSPAHAAENVVRLVTASERVNGRYYDEQRPARPNPVALDPATQRTLLRLSAGLTSPGPAESTVLE